MDTTAFYALVQGRVQGVGFRYSTVREAQRLRINGWIKNSYSGDVEVWAEGLPENLAAFFTWLHRGPQYSRVDSLIREDKEPRGYQDFNVEH